MGKGHCPPNSEESALNAASDRRGADKEVGTPVATSPHCVVASPSPSRCEAGQGGNREGRVSSEAEQAESGYLEQQGWESGEMEVPMTRCVMDTSCPPFLQTLWGTPSTADFWAPRTPRAPTAPSGGWWLKSWEHRQAGVLRFLCPPTNPPATWNSSDWPACRVPGLFQAWGCGWEKAGPTRQKWRRPPTPMHPSPPPAPRGSSPDEMLPKWHLQYRPCTAEHPCRPCFHPGAQLGHLHLPASPLPWRRDRVSYTRFPCRESVAIRFRAKEHRSTGMWKRGYPPNSRVFWIIQAVQARTGLVFRNYPIPGRRGPTDDREGRGHFHGLWCRGKQWLHLVSCPGSSCNRREGDRAQLFERMT